MKIVGCLTTLPKRLKYLKDTLISIKNQTLKLDILYLNIPYQTQKGEKYDMSKLEKIINEMDFKIKILRSKDWGSITKLIPILGEEHLPETIIITFDDDMLYDKNLVESLVKGSMKYPNSIIGTGGWIVGSFPFMYHSVHDRERKVDWVEGRTSILYKRKFFEAYDKVVKQIESNCQGLFPEHLKLHDDHILAYLTRNTEKVVVPGRKALIERMNIRHIDSISGNAIKYLNEASSMVKILKNEGVYKETMSWDEMRNCYGYKIIRIVVLVVLLILLLIILVRSNLLNNFIQLFKRRTSDQILK